MLNTLAGDRQSLADGDLIRELEGLRTDLLAFEDACARWLDPVQPCYRESARNLLHFIAFHRHDHPGLQRQLRERGLSSLEGCDGHLLASLNAVIERLTAAASVRACLPPASPSHGQAVELLQWHCSRLFGLAACGQANAIMVTLPAEAADHPGLIQELVEAGMGVARINCAHDDTRVWQALVTAVRSAAIDSDRPCRVSMDLGGPKLRTGPLPEQPGVVDARPRRDRYGRLLKPAQILAVAGGRQPAGAKPDPEISLLPVLQLPERDQEPGLAPGDRFSGRDASGRMRELTVVEQRADGLLLGCRQHCRFTEGLRFRREGGGAELQVGALPPSPGELLLNSGDVLELTATPGTATPGTAKPGSGTPGRGRHSISCTLPQVFSALRPGQRVLFDDGRIGGVIRAVNAEVVTIEITDAKPRGSRLRADKGINFPDSELQLPALTAKDRQDLAFAAAHADIVNYSFVSRTADVEALQGELEDLGATQLGVVLKIENHQAFTNLPGLLLTAMRRPMPLGVMIARGDLAVECGWEQLAAIQEEILRLCTAAHVPCIWATQVLDEMARHGTPTRAEISDAALGARADALMLNKGPNITATVRTLRHIAAGSLSSQPEHPSHRDRLRSCLNFRRGSEV
ncbi:pyruvate kinase [Cyanobium sp. CH-040]|uniref:pyruvate kinase n=1 Tax=Cyanobium sp. CH-040 TaxID=2823708 RepID=UPI0020CD13B0|nr:pyruvate kinase [Cyanobium sp. CH-040]MCP9929154.1 pyruvate kinase [Cyanobium sp. CH-040]